MSTEATEKKPIDFARGLEGVHVATTAISWIDGQNGVLLYRGIPIEEIAKHSNFEETSYLILYGKLPTKQQLEEFDAALKKNREIPDDLLDVIRKFPKDTHSMHVIRTAISFLGGFDPDAEDNTPEANYEKSIKIIAKFPTVVAAASIIRRGLEVIPPDSSLSMAANFLYMMSGEKPTAEEEKIMDTIMILHIEHGMNASTFSSIVTISTLADIYSAITSAIGTLKGPLHGGANERALRMIKEIGTRDNVRQYVENALANKQKIMGFGHRVYKAYDPRAKILRGYAESLSKSRGDMSGIEIAEEIEKIMIEKVGGKGIFPNVDFYSGLVYSHLNIPMEDFTPIFAMARSVGWCAHVMEYLEQNRIFRPRAVYVGSKDAHYVPIDERK